MFRSSCQFDVKAQVLSSQACFVLIYRPIEEMRQSQPSPSQGHFDCIVKSCWDQWIREMSFTRRPGSERPRQTSSREDRHIIRNARDSQVLHRPTSRDM
ncbi:hypothetical protein TNCV_475871 [Trichonephila clavipes]|nr:hypothetical protein TNCV_475871 [Trichonephila clavipes]